MRHLIYLCVLAGCLAGAVWLEPVLRVGVLRRWRRLLLTLVPVAVVFGLWDILAIRAGHWSYDPAQTLGVRLPGALPLEELLFFLVVPVCAILGFEAVRTVQRGRGWRAGDEPPADPPTAEPSADPPSADPPTDAPAGERGGAAR